MNVSGEQSFDLALVIRVEDVVKSQPAPLEVLLKPIPDGDDLRIIGNGAEYKSRIGP